MRITRWVSICCIILAANYARGQNSDTAVYHETYRPQLHFSPAAHWMNDPNGMVYYKHTYHLFFQYYPNGTTWGPMHWGHAVSKDMIHWKQLPIALYPDSLGYIFSGSAVVDYNNTSGFGKNGKTPLVAIFTHHDPIGEKEGKNNFQNESLAYSLDDGNNWVKYKGNPVLKNPGIRDFRDPKVMWYAPEHKWVMTLATHDHITFFSSRDLKNWVKESEFGKQLGAHGGVWECPDLFSTKLDGKTYWILIGNLNPGGPNGGSATQYFIGQFNGHFFIPIDHQTRWLDYGPDEYAGITWNNTGHRKIFLGWMSNWQYAGQVPTVKWRNAMTVPRELNLRRVKGQLFLASEPVKEINTLTSGSSSPPMLNSRNKFQNIPEQFILKFNSKTLHNYAITLSNGTGEELMLGYDKIKNSYYIDRTKSGKIDFNAEFGKSVFYAPRISDAKNSTLELVVDHSSVELFADKGLTVMTALFFPRNPYSYLAIASEKQSEIESLRLYPLKSIWK